MAHMGVMQRVKETGGCIALLGQRLAAKQIALLVAVGLG